IDRDSIDPILYKIVVTAVGFVSLADSIKAIGFEDNFYVNAMAKLPLQESGFGFVFAFIVSFLIALIIAKSKKGIE
ncbi:MAG: branched-chain amino acid transport system II carrier protein, partial [Anaerococcus sp.]|nr:branched-chain amino acid transport system II carrier protein [Anaerococcus sp.]